MMFSDKRWLQHLEMALNDLFSAADLAIQQGVSLIILSDKGINENQAAIPSLLAVSGLHHHLYAKEQEQ